MSSLRMAGATLLCVALLAFSSHSVSSRDDLLQTAYPLAPQSVLRPQQMMQQQYAYAQAAQQPQYAQARAVYPQQMQPQQYAQARAAYPQQMQLQQPPAIMGQAMPSLDEAPPAAAEGIAPEGAMPEGCY